jgi:glutamate dehydrogenase (NADP+)
MGKRVLISGAGNVALYACQKAIKMGAKVLTMSDSSGWIYDPNGINFNIIRDIKEDKKGRVKDYVSRVPGSIYTESNQNNPKVWSIPCDIALPCATQNEIDLEDAKLLVKNGCYCLCEGANMPTSLDAIHYLIENDVIFGPGKAANAGGVATSGLEMSQNSIRTTWTYYQVDAQLKNIMEDIFIRINYTNCKYDIRENDLLTGANIAGFEKIVSAMIMQGI